MKARPDWLVVARRELLERLTSKWFVVVTLLGPLFMIAAIVIPTLLATATTTVRLTIVDHTGVIAARAAPILEAAQWTVTLDPAANDTALLGAIRDQKVNGFVVVPPDALTGGAILYKGDNATNQLAMQTLHHALTAAVQAARGAAREIPDATLQAVLAPIVFVPEHTTGEATATSGFGAFALGYAVMFIVYLAIVLYGSNVLRSVIVEKTSRIAEIIVAAAKPQALMLGKILGVGGAGLIQMSVWLIIAALLIAFRDTILGWFGVAAGVVSLPALGFDGVVVSLAFFFVGFFFYASLFAAVGAMVTSEQEAQSAAAPVIMMLVIPVLCVQVIASDPRGGAATALTHIPFSAPMLMPMRYLLGGASLGETILSLGILALATWLVARLAAKVYRIGLLAQGRRPKLAEIWRWLRE